MWLAGVVTLDFVAVLVPRFSGAEVEWIGLAVGQCWARGGKLGDVAVDKFHLEGTEVVRVGHLVRMLNYQVGVRVRLPHQSQFVLMQVYSNDVVDGIGKVGNGVESLYIVLDNRHHSEIAESSALDEFDERNEFRSKD